jgi:hypothetical protein
MNAIIMKTKMGEFIDIKCLEYLYIAWAGSKLLLTNI